MKNTNETSSTSNSNINIKGNTLSKISFCDKECSNINDNNVKKAIINKLNSEYSIEVVNRDYNILNPNTLRIVSYHQHIITPYTNGNPYLLYLCVIDNVNCCIFIDKKLKDGYTFPKMHCVKYRFADELFKNETILSGELIKDNERRWLFLIDNILVYKGALMNEKNIISKFDIIHNIMNTEYTHDKHIEICPLQIKKLFMYKDIRKMVVEFIPNLPYTCKGIVFYTLKKCSNFALIIPKADQIEIKTPSEINDIVQEKWPKLWDRKYNTGMTNNNHSMIYDDSSDSGNSNTSNTSITKNTNTNTESNTIADDNVVFKILNTGIPDIYNLYCLDKSTMYKHSIALVPNIKISHYLYYKFKENSDNTEMNNLENNTGNIGSCMDMYVECKFSKVFEKWTPVRFINHKPYNRNDIEEIEERLKTKEN